VAATRRSGRTSPTSTTASSAPTRCGHKFARTSPRSSRHVSPSATYAIGSSERPRISASDSGHHVAGPRRPPAPPWRPWPISP
jgi:hypothetical protein